LCALGAAWGAVAQPLSVNSISFQGALTGADGQELANGNYNLTFKFYTNATTLTPLATSNVLNVPVTGGLASTSIPVDAAWFNGQTRYLGIAIAEINNGQELSPRVLITAVPHALSAQGVPTDNYEGSATDSTPSRTRVGGDRRFEFHHAG
jgi:hypothetical protein